MRALVICLVAGATVLAAPRTADAFCGFYVSGADGDLYNNATQVVLMREGTRTVLSMGNNYQGPPDDFAMVIPVPVVLQEENVKTLPDAVFKRIDQLAAPRLVEYWEQDPCEPPVEYEAVKSMAVPANAARGAENKDASKLGVTVEAQFDVGEYQIVILSAKDSTGLETWLRQEKYTIPKGADAFLRPYVQAGSKFFVAKVNAQKVTFKDGMAALSPLRFYYDSEDFTLPVRLGLMNAKGKQDLIVHILAPRQRFEVANYGNVTIPTNLDVVEGARGRFGEFYAALFDRTLAQNKGAVVTEYSWDAGSCDPCPTPPLSRQDLMTFGMDVLDTPMPKPKPSSAKKKKPQPKDAVDELLAKPSTGPSAAPRIRRPPVRFRSFVLTRLHARYDAESMKEDLVFKAADAIAGGRERRIAGGKLENGSSSSPVNNFQARYAIRHPWEGKIECSNPVRGRWGGPPGGKSAKQAQAALDLAFAPRGAKLAQLVKQDIPEIDVKAGAATDKPTDKPADKPTDKPADKPSDGAGAKKEKACGCQSSGGQGLPSLLLIGLAIGFVARRKRSDR